MHWKELFNGKSFSQRDHVLNLTKSGVFLEYPTISSPGQGREKSDVQIVSVRTLPTPLQVTARGVSRDALLLEPSNLPVQEPVQPFGV